jgi:ribosome-binding protein aMBF1 (putative translation factor)
MVKKAAGRRRERDFLDEVIAESTARNPRFPALLAEAEKRRRIGSALMRARKAKRLSQGSVAERMSTTQSVVSKLESGADVKLSTFLKYIGVVGVRLDLRTAARVTL